MSAVLGAALPADVQLAGEVADLAAIAFDDLPLLEQTEAAKRDLALLLASADELQERLWAGALDFESRQDVALDVVKLTARIQSWALTVLG